MGRNHTNLSNCYKPLPFQLPTSNQKEDGQHTSSRVTKRTQQQQQILPINRDDGNGQSRSPHGLRWLRIETGITSATGSALVELGHTKVLAEVIGPTTQPPNNTSSSCSMDEGTLECIVTYVPNVGYPLVSLVGATAAALSDNSAQPQQPSIGRMNTRVAANEKELASQLQASLAAAVPLQQYPKHWIIVQVTVLQDDGSTLSACTSAASMALVDASVEVYDMVTSATVAVTNSTDANNTSPVTLLLADPTYEEMAHASAVVTLSVMPNWKEVTLWNQSGRLSSTTANEAIALCRDGCRTMHKFMRTALLTNMIMSNKDGGEGKEDVVMKDS